jgi:hypothetical protein
MSVSIGALVLAAVTSGQDGQLQELQKMVQELQQEVSELKMNNKDAWLTEQRADEIQGLVREILSDSESRYSLVGSGATAGYNGGAFLMSEDGNWKMKINAQLQTRWNYNDANEQPTRHGFEQRRTKIKFSGHILEPSWTYKISGTWGRGGGGNTEDAWIGKSFDSGSWIKVGQFKSKFLREHLVSSSAQLAVERSMVNNAFTYGWTQGVELGWGNEELRLSAQYTDGPNQRNTALAANPTNAWNLRGELKFGDAGWKEFGSFTSKHGGGNGLLLGLAYQDFDRSGSTIKYGNAIASSSNGWTIDISIRGDGWNIFGYVVNAKGSDFGVEQKSSGWLVQGGFMVSDNSELFAQYQRGKIDDAVFVGASNEMSAIRLGINYWPTAGNKSLKWTTDIAWSQDALAKGDGTGASSADANWTSSGNGWRGDVNDQDGQMLLRTQLQLLF